MKKLVPFLMVMVFLFVTACGNTGSNALSQLQDEGVVKVGFANEAPYAYEEDGELKGASVEIARAVYKELGVEELDGHLAKWKELIPGLKSEKFSTVTAGMAIQPDRCEQVAFSEPTIKYGEGMVVQAGNPQDLHSYQDIADNPDVTVVVMSGATENDFLKQAGVSEDQIMHAPDIAATLSAVKSERADVTTATEMTVKKAMQSSEGSGLEYVKDFQQPDVDGVPSYGAAAFHPDNDELREAYNEKLQELRESGKIKEILQSLDLWGEENYPEDDVTMEQLCQG